MVGFGHIKIESSIIITSDKDIFLKKMLFFFFSFFHENINFVVVRIIILGRNTSNEYPSLVLLTLCMLDNFFMLLLSPADFFFLN